MYFYTIKYLCSIFQTIKANESSYMYTISYGVFPMYLDIFM